MIQEARRTFSRNTLLNFTGQAFVILLAVGFLPFIVSRLGDESFGLLSILWVLVGSLQVLDLGIGVGSAKFLSAHVSAGRKDLAAGTVQGTLLLIIPAGLLISAGLFSATFLDIPGALNIPTALHGDAVAGLRLLVILPLAIFLQNGFKSVLVAFQRFDLINALLAGYGVLQWGGAGLVLVLGGGFVDVVLATVAARILVMALTAISALRLLPEVLTYHPGESSGVIRQLLRFGGWVSVSQVISPVFGVLDRVYISTLVSLSAVAYFSVVTDVALRLLIVPMSFASTLLPVVSGGWDQPELRGQIRALYERSLRYTLAVMLPVVISLWWFPEEILGLWLGEEYAVQSAPVLMVVAVGLLGNLLAQLPFATLQAMGRPDIPAKLILGEIVLYAVVCFWLTDVLGIVGTALAWSLRVTSEAAILLWSVHRRMNSPLPGIDASPVVQ